MIVYRVGGHDAELLAPEFHPGSVDAGLELSADYRRVCPATSWRRSLLPPGFGVALPVTVSMWHRNYSNRPGQGRPSACRVLRALVGRGM